MSGPSLEAGYKCILSPVVVLMDGSSLEPDCAAIMPTLTGEKISQLNGYDKAQPVSDLCKNCTLREFNVYEYQEAKGEKIVFLTRALHKCKSQIEKHCKKANSNIDLDNDLCNFIRQTCSENV